MLGDKRTSLRDLQGSSRRHTLSESYWRSTGVAMRSANNCKPLSSKSEAHVAEYANGATEAGNHTDWGGLQPPV